MPELPEVQTVVSQLNAKVVGLTFESFHSEWEKAARPSLGMIRKSLIGTKIIGVRRFGKHIVIDASNAHSLVIHLKMTGHLLVKTPENEHEAHFKDDPYNGYIRHVIRLSGGVRIEFSDLRKFGWLEVVSTESVERMKSIQELGVDALSDDFTPKYLWNILKERPKSLIGNVLLEQNRIAGIGNIYRNEALFRSGILPTRRAQRLTQKDTNRLHEAIQEVLREALIFRGMSDGDFRDTDGRSGEFENNIFVYGREGAPCKKCGTIIVRMKLGQRSVFFCPRCQK